VAAWWSVLGAMGLVPRDHSADQVPDDVAAMVAARDAARASKDFGTADTLRAELESLGWLIEDGAQGGRARRA
jgi:cysteinyl-tRNA synthetase